MRYIDYQYKPTKNNSFLCKELRFVLDNTNDTLLMNIRLPLKVNIASSNDPIAVNIIDYGIYSNCHLRKDTIYTIGLKKICISEISDICNSYYKTNAVFDSVNCSEFTEIENDNISRNDRNCIRGSRFVDIKGILYEIISLTPNNDCFYLH